MDRKHDVLEVAHACPKNVEKQMFSYSKKNNLYLQTFVFQNLCFTKQSYIYNQNYACIQSFYTI